MSDGFQPAEIIRVLNEERVAHVVIGGYAAQLYRAARPTEEH